MVSRGGGAVYNLIFSGERIIPTRNIQLYRIRLIIKWKTMGEGGRQERAVLALWRKPVLSKLRFLPHHFLEIGSSFPSSTPPKGKTPHGHSPSSGWQNARGKVYFKG